jgi:D-alanyl-D-alanine carboxypeptidase
VQGLLKFYKNILCLITIFTFASVSSAEAIKSASIVMCGETGKIHHEQNADTITHPASLTKMMTLYLTFKALKEKKLSYNQPLYVSKHASVQSPCKLYLKPGSTITVKQAILGMVTKSANDAAVAIAEALGNGSEAQFAVLMTKQARALGMSNTVFKNASGLPHKQQITTARDMATLSHALYKHFPKEFAFFKEQTFTYKGQKHRNHNHLLGKIAGVDGIKTGFINASGFNLAASMVRDNKRIIAVVMGGTSAKSRDKQMVKLLEATHKNIKGKKPQNMDRYTSIGDIINTVDPIVNNSLPMEDPIQKATYLTGEGNLQGLDEEVESLDALLEVIDSSYAKPKIIKTKATKPQKKKAKSAKPKHKKVKNVHPQHPKKKHKSHKKGKHRAI